MGIHFALLCSSLSVGPQPGVALFSRIIVAATDVALVGSYLCLSIAYIMIPCWDTWFFRLAYRCGDWDSDFLSFAPPVAAFLRGLENSTAGIALVGMAVPVGKQRWRWGSSVGNDPSDTTYFSLSYSYTGESHLFTMVYCSSLSALAAMRIMQREQLYASRGRNRWVLLKVFRGTYPFVVK